MQLAELNFEGNAARALSWADQESIEDREDAEASLSPAGCDPYSMGVNKFNLLTRDEERELGNRALNQDLEARNRIVEGNLRLVLHVVNRYYRNRRDLGTLSDGDLIDEGNLGLIRAAELFDPSRGFHFSTYAVWWIRQYIDRLVTNRRQVVHIPYHVTQVRREQYRADSRARREPGLEEDLPDRDGDQVPEAPDLAPLAGAKEERLRRRAVEAAGFSVLSLDAPSVGGESGSDTLVDRMEDHEIQSPERRMEDLQVAEVLRRALATLPPKERSVLAMRFGIGTGEELSLAEIGAAIGCSRENIRRIQIRAMAALRSQLDGGLL